MVKAGRGATLLPGIAVDAGLAQSAGLKVVRLAPPAPGRKIGVAWRKGSGRAEEAMLLAASLKDALGAIGRPS